MIDGVVWCGNTRLVVSKHTDPSSKAHTRIIFSLKTLIFTQSQNPKMAVQAEEYQQQFYEWICGICKPILVFMTLVGFAASYAYHTIENLHDNSPKTSCFLSFYTVVGWVAAFVARTQLYGFGQLIGLSWVVSCRCTLALVVTAVSEAYFYNTEVYVLGSCIVLSLILFGIPVFRFHKKLRMLKAAERAELTESVAREMMLLLIFMETPTTMKPHLPPSSTQTT